MAPAERHLVVRDRTLHLDAGPERWSLRPSVDVLFESIAAGHADDAVGCLLTGMGRDGAEGLLAIRRSGGSTLAQDEQSSVVFGMPGEAVRIGAAERVVPLDRIAAELVSLVRAQEPAA
jgi:two-component system chemotaxis response regulator CheB